ncbi:MAG TPA: Type 1 glutamine amidotransferase-like domain-containing protein [Spirochaetota bacterium]|nr:Type 1 glutamine amidotransferase-like domain-containing protein [Spirochaetota bacterium]
MKQLFLSSSFSTVAKNFIAFAGDDLKGKRVTFIPTASVPEKVIFYVASGRKALEKLGMIVDELELSTATRTEIEAKIRGNDYIYVSGGNTFFLLQEMKKTGADKIIKDEIASGKIYIGESAGSMILSPDIEYSKEMDDRKKAPELKDTSALSVIDFYPLPHYTNFPFKKAAEKIITNYQDKIPLQPISNSQVILVKGESMKIEKK